VAKSIDAAVAIHNAFRRDGADIDAAAPGSLWRLRTLGPRRQIESRHVHP
jgi:hypothetical protein